MTIVEFLTARLDQDAADVHGQGTIAINELEAACKCASEDAARRVDCPARWASDIAAKRAILADHKAVHTWPDDQPWCRRCNPDTDYPCPTLRLLAQPYSDHPDYNQSWKH